MIIPSKHIELSESLIGLGAFLIQILKYPLSVDECWIQLNKTFIETGKIKKKHSFDNFILTIDLLYALGILEFNSEGELFNVLKRIEQ